MSGTSELKRYSDEVVKAWDEASGNFKDVCSAANDNTTVRKYFENNGWYELKEWYASKESIDGVWTKVQIYTEAFEGYIIQFEKKEINEDELLQKSVDIWERMLSDLIAMNTDDLRNGEMAVAVTNIIDINHLRGLRWKVFSDSMATAMWNIIEENDIMMTAWETAILWNPKQVEKINIVRQDSNSDILALLREELWEWNITRKVEKIMSSSQRKIDVVLEEIEFNIWGTSLWITDGRNKLFPLKSWQTIIALQEKRKDGIIWPRSNGVTAIRNHMTKLGWSGWENLSFNEFLEKIGEDKADKISDDIKMLCKGRKMWEIATGKTTIFNPFVSRTLLGWVDWEAQVNLSSIIHVTGNPGKKIADGLEWVWVELDIKDVVLPTIIEILQSVWDISDEDAIKGWNMWVPYALVCDESEADKVIELAKKEGILAQRIWTTTEEQEGIKWTIKWVWIWNSEIQLAA